MDFLFGGGGGQASSLAGAAAIAAASAAASVAITTSHVAAVAAAAAAAASAAAAHAPETSSRAHYASEHTSTSEVLHETFTHTAQHAIHQHHFNGHDNGPILYTDSNRTSAIDDIRSVVIYIFIITIFLCFFLILPGIRNEKLPTFFCITTSLFVGSIIIVSLFGTSWHVGEAPISAAYKAFSRDRIQGDLAVRMGLQSVNISLKAHKYYILHATDGPMIMENIPPASSSSPMLMMMSSSDKIISSVNTMKQPSESFNNQVNSQTSNGNGQKLADELLVGRTADGISVDTELESEEVFAASTAADLPAAQMKPRQRAARSSASLEASFKNESTSNNQDDKQDEQTSSSSSSLFQKYTIRRVHVDINYNERFYWIGPMQMRQEYHQALERGLPYPILTVVEYLSQDEAGFNWSRQYRAAGYYTSMCLWLSASVCVLMFCLHCAAPKYGIYAMQILGLLLLFTNLTYATLVPRGDQKLVIPFQGQSLAFRFGWNFWLVLVGGCLSLLVGTIIVIIDNLFPNFIFTTILDADFDSPHRSHYQRKHKILGKRATSGEGDDFESSDDRSSNSSVVVAQKKPKLPPFMRESVLKKRTSKSRNIMKTTTASSKSASSSIDQIDGADLILSTAAIYNESKLNHHQQQQQKHSSGKKTPTSDDNQFKAIEGSNTSENKRLPGAISLRRLGQTTTSSDVDQERRSQAANRTSSIDKRDIDSRESISGQKEEEDSGSQHTIRL